MLTSTYDPTGPGKESALQEFYRDASVLVTGDPTLKTTVLVEKLLRSCLQIARVYVLTSPRSGRVDQSVSSPYFEELKQLCRGSPLKLAAVSGHLGSRGLGLSDDERQQLSHEVKVVFHVAETAQPDENMKDAILRDVRGTRELLALCRTFRKLKSVVYVTPARPNSVGATVDEVLMEPDFSCTQAIDMAEYLEGDQLNYLLLRLLGRLPPSNEFLTTISEHAVKVYGRHLPIAVVRSPTGSTNPRNGTLDQFLSSVNCQVAVNCVIASAWDVAENRCASQPTVYNCVLPQHYGSSWDKVKYTAYMKAAPTTHDYLTAIDVVMSVVRFLHVLPTVLSDFSSYLSSKENRYLENRPPVCRADNVGELWQRLTPSDQQEFHFDPREGMRTTIPKDPVAM